MTTGLLTLIATIVLAVLSLITFHRWLAYCNGIAHAHRSTRPRCMK